MLLVYPFIFFCLLSPDTLNLKGKSITCKSSTKKCRCNIAKMTWSVWFQGVKQMYNFGGREGCF